MGRTPKCSVFSHVISGDKRKILKEILLCLLIRCDPFQPTTRAPLRTLKNSLISLHYVELHEIICMNLSEHLKRGERWLLCKEELVSNHLTGFKKHNWDQIFSVWQSGQYRAPVIKPLPVKHPARIDEFSPGEGGAVTGASGAWRRDFEHGTVPGMLKSICEGRAILATSDFKTDHEKRSWLALTGQTRRLLAVSKCTSNTK